MSLTIDVGNSRIKWAQWQAGKIIARGASAHAKGELSANLDVLFASVKKPSAVYSVCVASNEVRNTLTQWIKQHWQMEVDYLTTERKFNGVIHGYDDPAQHGADRWAAIIAAQNLYPDVPLCVIGAGTAMTVDFLKADGRHLGGYILPSYTSMHAVLMGDTAKVDAEPVFNHVNINQGNADHSSEGLIMHGLIKEGWIPSNTNDAVMQGLHRLLQAGVRDFCLQAKHVLGDTLQVIISGGFAEMILSYPDVPEMRHEPDLVIQGLYLIKTTKP